MSLNILFLAIEFPPLNTTGNYRSAKFVKYFREFGIHPIVVTLDTPSALKWFPKASCDYQLLEELPEDTPIIRIPCEDPPPNHSNQLKNFMTVVFRRGRDDFNKLWRKNLFERLNGIFKQYQPQLVLTSLPPFGAGPLASEISRKFDVPLILDMRDGWTFWRPVPYPTWLNYFLEHHLAHQTLKQASSILGVSRQLNDSFKCSYTDIAPHKFHVIPNGFDHDEKDWKEVEIPPRGKREYTIGYVGVFYYFPKYRELMTKPWRKRKGHQKFYYVPRQEDYLYRTPYFFFKTLAELFKRRPDLKTVIKIKFIGDKPGWMEEMIHEFALESNCFFYGSLSRHDALKVEETFDAFLNTTTKVKDGEDYMLSLKVFDYVLFRKPILGFVLKGALKEFLEQCGLGFIFNPDDPDQSSALLEKVIEGGFTLKPNAEYLNQFHRRFLTGRLSGIIKNTINERNHFNVRNRCDI